MVKRKQKVVKPTVGKKEFTPRPPVVTVLGHIDHGKCIVGDTRIPLTDGQLVPARQLFKMYYKNDRLVKENEADKIIAVKNGPEVFSFDGERIIKKKISHLWKLKAPRNLVKIKLFSGDEIITTPEHPYLVFTEKAKIENKKASDIQLDDFILVPKNLNFSSSLLEVKKEIVNSLSKTDNFVIFTDPKKNKKFYKKLRNENLWQLTKKGLFTTHPYTCFKKKRFRARDFINLASYLGFNLKEIYEMIGFIKNSTKKWRAGHTSNRVRLPQSPFEFRKFGYVLGCMAGDGYINEGILNNNNLEIQKNFCEILNKVLRVNTRIKKTHSCQAVFNSGGKTFSRLLTDILGFPDRDKSANVSIPPIVLLYEPLFVGFVEGWFDTDGYVSELNHCIEMTSKSKRIVKEVGIHLLRFGIHSTIYEKNNFHYLRIANKPYLENFFQVFTPRFSFKRERVREALPKSSTSRIFDLTPIPGSFLQGVKCSNKEIPYFNQYKLYKNLPRPLLKRISDMGKLKMERELRAVVNTDVSCSRVRLKEIIKNKEDFVYDFTIPETENFIAERIIIHNTTLLDFIRKENVAQKEAGGITQHIGAYQAKLKIEDQEKLITFIDTPGHEAFSKMRSRGAKVADIALLVISAKDGVMPQTKESIAYIKKAKISMIVAINKIDLFKTKAERQVAVKKIEKQLKKLDILVEKEGGKAISLPISAKTGEGVKDLLEMIILLSEIEGIKVEKNAPLKGVIIDAQVDRRRGVLATVLVREGSLRVGDPVEEVEGVKAKVKALFDEYGKKVKIAGPSKPVQVLGFEKPPPIGGIVTLKAQKTISVPSEPSVPSVITELSKKRLSPEAPEDKLKIILKTDTLGTKEAILATLSQKVEIVSSGIGDISQSDVFLAKTAKALILGFSVSVLPEIKKLAQNEKVKIKIYEVIYKLLEEVDEIIEFLKQEKKEKVLGKGEIITLFEVKKKRIAGVKVLEGRIARGDKIKILRGEEEIGQGKIVSLRHQKEDIPKAEMGEECGIGFSKELDFQVGDVVKSIG